MKRVYNFSPGPSMLPDEVMTQISKELTNWQKMGVSAMEISHHHPKFLDLLNQIQQDLRDLLDIPDNYKILLMNGGGQGQFFAVPMNLFNESHKQADYCVTGIWSRKAAEEARKYGEINVACETTQKDFISIPDMSQWKLNPSARYVHYVDNETVNGIEFDYVPKVKPPLVTDMSSNLLTRKINIKDFGVIYAASQKLLGIAGFALVIIREDLLHEPLAITPSIFSYQEQVKRNSKVNSPMTFSWYVASLILKWIKKKGGVSYFEKLSTQKSQLIYDVIDEYPLYVNKVDKRYRSRINPIFYLADESLQEKFLKEAEAQGLFALKGHALVGGLRASMYNAMPLEGAQKLAKFMVQFAKKNKQ